MVNRRSFIQQLSMAGFALQLGNFPKDILFTDENITKITILHTNDVHSRIMPFPEDGSRNAGLGGASKRAALIDSIRVKEKNVLLFDSGDIMQGTPYFNFYGGELEMKLMSEMKYDAGTMGNHDFDGGIDGFVKQMAHANFPFLVSNYNFDDTLLNGKTKSYKVFEKNKVKIGVFGLGIELDGLVPKDLYKGTVYQDPIKEANRVVSILKNDEKCDYIICLSHLGYKYGQNKVSDIVLAEQTSDLDLILGGHTHTFLKEPTLVKNKIGDTVIVNQAGWGGIMLGQIDLYFERNKPGKCLSCKNLKIG